MQARYNQIGKIYGRLTVVGHAGTKGDKRNVTNLWQCKCVCGNEKIVSTRSLTSGGCKSCGCLHKETAAMNIKNATPQSNGRLLPGNQAAINTLLAKYKYGAKKRNLSWSLTSEEFMALTSDKCYYCGDAPTSIIRTRSKYPVEYTYNGIDRLDNSQGYETQNCVTCCKTCNLLKVDAIYEEFLVLIEKIYKQHFT